uniref:Putative ATPase domain containing protein n=1 Tax=viral metagenome TaxID=1070528 RepID=A0A6M3JRS6_9ZZZZ
MLTFIEAINFQRHRHTRLDLSDGVNALVGDSDAGKSSIFRLVYWVVFNRPLGDEFISHWADTAEARIGLAEGLMVGRVRGKAGNYYYIEHPDGKREEFKAPGSGPPPDAIIKLLNIDTINFQGQMAGPFLLGDSSAEVARFLNRIVDLEVIDKSLTAINGRLRREQQSANMSKVLADQAEADLAKYAWIDGAEADLGALEILDSARKRTAQGRDALKALSEGLAGAEYELVELSRVVATMDRGVKGLEKDYGIIQAIGNRYSSLHDQHKALVDMETELAWGRELLSHEIMVTGMEGMRAEIVEQSRRYDALADRHDELAALEKDLLAAKGDLDKVHKEYETMAPDECPVCGTPKGEWRK